MTTGVRDPLGAVGAHYDRWPFPGLDHTSPEGLMLLRSLTRWLAPAAAGPLRVIDVGCGTGHTVLALAAHFPDVEFVGVDLSEGSLDVARALARERGASHVRFHHVDLVSGVEGLGAFRVVLCLGVLHHVPDIEVALDRVASLLDTEGHLVLWLYGRHGRYRHALNRRFLELLGSGMSDGERLTLAEAFIDELGPRFATDTGFYTPCGSGEPGIAWLREHPQWLADQLLPAYEASTSLPEIRERLRRRSLRIDRWFGVATDLRAYTECEQLTDCFDRLSAADRLVAIDLLLKPAYYFLAATRAGAEV